MAQSNRDTAEGTVVAVFEDYSSADRVVRALVDAGIPRDSIEVKSNFMTGAAGRTGYSEESHEGGISGFFHRLFGSDEADTEAGHYMEAHRRGKTIVCVTAPPEQSDRAVEILNAGGATDIDRHVERFRKTGYTAYDPNTAPYTSEEVRRERERLQVAEEGASIPVMEEEMQVGKRAVRRGGVRVYSRIVEEPVTESVELREEHVKVERRPVDRPLGSGEAERFREQSIEVAEMAEEPVVQKRTRVREEVVVGKETTRRTEQVRGNVRRTKVEVEPLGAAEDEDYRSDFRRDWQERYANSGEAYETFEPAYSYGYRSASDPRYQGRDWSDAEEDLRTDYLRNNPNSAWDRFKGAVRYGWEKVTGKR